jgi:hypothetical protein
MSNEYPLFAKRRRPPMPSERRSIDEVLDLLEREVAHARTRETKLNRRLGYPDDHCRGSLSVYLRWDDAQTLLDGLGGVRDMLLELLEKPEEATGDE